MGARILSSLLERMPGEQRKRLRRFSHPAWLGTLRRLSPLSVRYGYDRGTPVDRYYIETFLEAHCQDIRGRVLEVKDSTYTDRYGVGVAQKDILDINPANQNATLVTDLAQADGIPAGTFDCIILTQTLQVIYDFRGAVAHIHRILRPDGVMLLTVPSVSRIEPRLGLNTDYWRFTAASCRLLFEEFFGPDHVTVTSYGNVLTAVAFLMGMAHEELSTRELDQQDDYFPIIIGVRAVKC